jgi:hypothetical protein
VESALDAEPLKLSGIAMYGSMDEPGSLEQEGKITQQEIDISTVDYQVSTEPAPDSSVLTSTIPPDEKQPEVEPSRHTKEV